MERIGLIAGNRKLPFLLAQAAKKNNYYIVAVAIKGDTSSKLNNFVDKIYWLGLNEFQRMFEIFKNEGLQKIFMAGQITPRRLFSKEINKDSELKKLLAGVKDKRADSIFGAIARKIEEAGFQLMNSTIFLQDLLVEKGTLTRNQPAPALWEDIYFGLELAKEIAYLDIGQAVAIKDKAIVAVEALEGTDNLIRRAGKISRGGFTMVKVSKPKQDMRFDVPVVGLNTIKNLVRVKAKCLALEADKTIFIDKEESLELADKKGISIVAV